MKLTKARREMLHELNRNQGKAPYAEHYAPLPGWPPTKLSQMQADDRERWIADTASTLEALRPGSRFTVDGVECVVVRKDALDWLNGEGDSFERPDNVRGNFWWRGEFRRRAMLRACEEKS